jgi:hypothetical protein
MLLRQNVKITQQTRGKRSNKKDVEMLAESMKGSIDINLIINFTTVSGITDRLAQQEEHYASHCVIITHFLYIA